MFVVLIRAVLCQTHNNITNEQPFSFQCYKNGPSLLHRKLLDLDTYPAGSYSDQPFLSRFAQKYTATLENSNKNHCIKSRGPQAACHAIKSLRVASIAPAEKDAIGQGSCILESNDVRTTRMCGKQKKMGGRVVDPRRDSNLGIFQCSGVHEQNFMYAACLVCRCGQQGLAGACT